ncbi:hypothetical protein [Chamaesiphon sp. OTE_75_metabat_556]|uniref:hypothetical protein n=1 Tax=Chamaesiphon sp. OTE_75_metabat_556 TaxID=2964692 RepID=UPI00286B50C8|nr:hypothetical protein [Chamaesiphon sp. OTE_75_metabat_556]
MTDSSRCLIRSRSGDAHLPAAMPTVTILATVVSNYVYLQFLTIVKLFSAAT